MGRFYLKILKLKASNLSKCLLDGAFQGFFSDR